MVAWTACCASRARSTSKATSGSDLQVAVINGYASLARVHITQLLSGDDLATTIAAGGREFHRSRNLTIAALVPGRHGIPGRVVNLGRPCLGSGACRATPGATPAPRHGSSGPRRVGSSTSRGYDRQWRKVHLEVLRRDGYACRWCGAPGRHCRSRRTPCGRGSAPGAEQPRRRLPGPATSGAAPRTPATPAPSCRLRRGRRLYPLGV